MTEHDVVVIGSGTGGYPAALYLAKKGYRVALVEEGLVGGECTNYGCVPSKAFYSIAESIRQLEKAGGEAAVKWEGLVEFAKSVVREDREGLEYLIEANDVKLYRCRGQLKAPRLVKVACGEGEISAKHVLVAPGTNPRTIPGAEFDGKLVVSNREVFYLDKRPDRLVIVGGGVVGVEVAYAFSALGTKVVVIEALDHILPTMDQDVAAAVRRHLAGKGVDIREKCPVAAVEKGRGVAKVKACSEFEADTVLIAIGRSPRTVDLWSPDLPIKTDRDGFILVDPACRTSVDGVFAAGDVTGGALLAHKAIMESLTAAMNIEGRSAAIRDYGLVPMTIFTGLEVAHLGYTEKELAARGIKYKRLRLPLYFLPAVKIRGDKNAFAKLLLSEDGSKVLGITLVAPNASEAISAYLPLYMGKIWGEELALTPYPHLTVGESLRDIAEALFGEPIHILMKK